VTFPFISRPFAGCPTAIVCCSSSLLMIFALGIISMLLKRHFVVTARIPIHIHPCSPRPTPSAPGKKTLLPVRHCALSLLTVLYVPFFYLHRIKLSCSCPFCIVSSFGKYRSLPGAFFALLFIEFVFFSSLQCPEAYLGESSGFWERSCHGWPQAKLM